MIAVVAALAIASSATAQTITIRITGATAFRKAANNSIKNILNPGYVYGYAGSSLDSAGKAEFQGTTIVGNIPVNIKLLWIGSAGGVQCLVQDINQSGWLAATNLTSGAGTSGLTGPTDSGVADAAFSDAFQGSTLFTTPQLVDNILGVIAFQWTKNRTAPAGVTNMTPLQAQALLSAGIMPLSQLTGSAADQSTIAYATGRDPDSGTRIVTFAEGAFGVFTPPVQYEMLGTAGTNGNVTSIRPFPATTVLGIPYGEGQSGYASGGTMANWMNTPNPDVFIGYMSTDDAARLVAPAAALTWNGVAYSKDAVRQGLYTFWCYEHLFWRTSLSGSKLTVMNALVDRIKTVDADLSGVLLSTMAVGRTVEGGVVTFGNPY
jgi:hypothetical protein